MTAAVADGRSLVVVKPIVQGGAGEGGTLSPAGGREPCFASSGTIADAFEEVLFPRWFLLAGWLRFSRYRVFCFFSPVVPSLLWN